MRNKTKTLIAIIVIVGIFLGVFYLNKNSCGNKIFDFQIQCNPDKTECTADFSGQKCDYGFQAYNKCYDKDCFEYMMSKSDCEIISSVDFQNDYPKITKVGNDNYNALYPEARGIIVRYVYELKCKSIGELNLPKLP